MLMSVYGCNEALRHFGEVIAPGMEDSVRGCHVEQMSKRRANALIMASRSVGGVSIRPIARAGEPFYGGSMTKLDDTVIFRGVFKAVANSPIPLDRDPIIVEPGNVAVALETTGEAAEGALALSQVRDRADDIYPVSRDLQHVLV